MRSVLRLTVLAAALVAVAACKPNAPATGANGAANDAANSAAQVQAGVTGAGASFVYPLMSKWAADYAKVNGGRINYQSIGSGGGIAQIKAGTVAFGSSDKPLPPEELAASGLAQFPDAIGGVVPVVNLDGVDAGKLKLTGALLGDIFLGKITLWNDPAIAKVNEGVALPAVKINLVHRSDGSGTTFNFTNYLSKVNAEWKTKIGEGTTVNWAGGIGGKGNEGVSAYVKQLKGSLGYVELSYALQNKMAHVQLQNAAGNWVQPSAETFAAAATSADWKNAKDFNLVITNAPGAQAWPITATNFILMQKTPKNPADRKAALDFFKWAFEHGQDQAKALDYVPLPPELVQQVEAYWAGNFK